MLITQTLKWALAISGIIGYFALASYFKYSYPSQDKRSPSFAGSSD